MGAFAYGLLALFIAYMAFAAALFVLSIGCFIRALGHGDAAKLPKHLSLNPFNVLINARSLDKEGIRLRNLGVRYLIYFFLVAFIGVAFQGIVQLFVGGT
jgi:hypothetical protein